MTQHVLPDGVTVSERTFNEVRDAVRQWQARAEADVVFLSLLVDVAAHTRPDSTSIPATESQALLKSTMIGWPMFPDAKAILRQHLALNESRTRVEWRDR